MIRDRGSSRLGCHRMEAVRSLAGDGNGRFRRLMERAGFCGLGLSLVLAASAAEAGTLTVTNATDSAAGGSLRAAILAAGAGDTIVFDITTGSPPFVITCGVSLPEITVPIVIDGTTQTGYLSAPVIIVQGHHDLASVAFRVSGGGATIRGLAITRWGIGVHLVSSGNTIEKNHIGADDTGEDPTLSKLDDNLFGVRISSGSNNQIQNNLISANGTGLLVEGGASAEILGNRIGTNITGMTVLANSVGILLSGSAGVHIGDGTNLGRNVISGNGFGIQINGTSTGTQILGNRIGPNVNGTGPVMRTDGGVPAGVGNFLDGILVNTTAGSTGIGDAAASAAINEIAHNRRDGIRVQNGAPASIRRNSIFSNAPAPPSTAPGLGINLCTTATCNEGVTPNDIGDDDAGPNGLQNFPVLSQAVTLGGSTAVLGTLASTPSTDFTIDFYASPACDASGNGEGLRYLGSVDVATDAFGGTIFTAPSLAATTPSEVVTATATAPDGSTSEFSACRPVIVPPGPFSLYTVTPCRAFDTRSTAAPPLSGGTSRDFAVAGACDVPADAKAVVLNITVVGPTAAGDLRLFPTGFALPLVSTINYRRGRTRANFAITGVGTGGSVTVRCDQPAGTTVHMIMDVYGYLQ